MLVFIRCSIKCLTRQAFCIVVDVSLLNPMLHAQERLRSIRALTEVLAAASSEDENEFSFLVLYKSNDEDVAVDGREF